MDRDQLLREVRTSLLEAQNRMKQLHDQHHQERQFEVGSWVLLRVRPYRQLSLAARRNLKLSPKFYGIFRVLERIVSVTYKLQLPTTSRLHPLFHVSLLKRWHGDGDPELCSLPELDEEVLQPHTIL